MDITSMRYFIEVAKTGNITTAAKNLFISQPALSKQISILEKELGQNLILRQNRGIQLTAAGTRLLEGIKQIVYMTDDLIADFNTQSEDCYGIIRIACAENTQLKEILDPLVRFRARHSKVVLKLLSCDTVSAIQMLNSGSVDLCITFASAKNDKYTEINTGIKRRTGIVMQNNDQLSRFSELHLEQIEKIPLYGPERNVFANNERLLSIYDKLNIVTFVDIPILFLDLIRLGGDYMLCIEPSQEDLLKNGLCFRPVTPQMTFPIKILRNKIAEDNIAVDKLMSYFAQFYNNRK